MSLECRHQTQEPLPQVSKLVDQLRGSNLFLKPCSHIMSVADLGSARDVPEGPVFFISM